MNIVYCIGFKRLYRSGTSLGGFFGGGIRGLFYIIIMWVGIYIAGCFSRRVVTFDRSSKRVVLRYCCSLWLDSKRQTPSFLRFRKELNRLREI